MSILSDVTSSKFNFVMLQVDTTDFSLSNSTPMDLLNATEEFSTCKFEMYMYLHIHSFD